MSARKHEQLDTKVENTVSASAGKVRSLAKSAEAQAQALDTLAKWQERHGSFAAPVKTRYVGRRSFVKYWNRAL